MSFFSGVYVCVCVCIKLYVCIYIHMCDIPIPQAGARALILSPTRELAAQTMKFTKEVHKADQITLQYIYKTPPFI